MPQHKTGTMGDILPERREVTRMTAPKNTQLSTRDESGFKKWYATMATKHSLNAEPNGQFYDYRGAYLAHATPDQTGHWPSTYKQPGHPNEFVGGFSTITGERQPGTTLATEAELKALGWDDDFARKNGSDKARPR